MSEGLSAVQVGVGVTSDLRWHLRPGLSRLPQVPVPGGGDAPVPSNHLTMSEQDASWGGQGG